MRDNRILRVLDCIDFQHYEVEPLQLQHFNTALVEEVGFNVLYYLHGFVFRHDTLSYEPVPEMDFAPFTPVSLFLLVQSTYGVFIGVRTPSLVLHLMTCNAAYSQPPKGLLTGFQ